MRIIFDGVLLAFQLLTTIPISKQVEWDEKRAKASLAAYPFIGLILGLLLAVQAYFLLEWMTLSPIVITAWLFTFSILYSGGLHVDGWADFHDAVFSRRETKQKLEIMKDPRVGAFAVLAVLFLLGWRFIFLFEIVSIAGNEFIVALVLIPLLVRLLLGWQLLLGSFAREDGMAFALKQAKGPALTWVYIGWTFTAMIMTFIYYPPFLLFFVGTGLFLFCWLKWVKYQLGGMTGDTLGAGAEGGETILWGILWLLLLFGMG